MACRGLPTFWSYIPNETGQKTRRTSLWSLLQGWHLQKVMGEYETQRRLRVLHKWPARQSVAVLQKRMQLATQSFLCLSRPTYMSSHLAPVLRIRKRQISGSSYFGGPNVASGQVKAGKLCWQRAIWSTMNIHRSKASARLVQRQQSMEESA